MALTLPCQWYTLLYTLSPPIMVLKKLTRAQKGKEMGIWTRKGRRKNTMSKPCKLIEFTALSFTLSQSFLAPRAKRMTQAYINDIIR